MKQGKFIVTMDKDIAKKLSEKGLQMISSVGNTYTFINNGNVNFSENENQKITFTNILNC